jgi:predicted transcriptional regulator
MEEEVKRHLLGLIPKKVGMLMARHRECAEKFPSFWQTFPERFAKMFEEEPEKTLKRFLALGNEECAWEKEDFMYRDLHLDNFIGREIARELKLELDQMEDFEIDKGEAERAELLLENTRLKRRLYELEEEHSRLKAAMEDRVGEGEDLRLRCKGLEERLKECLRRREPKKLARMARIMRLVLEEKNITPSYASRELGINIRMLHDYLAELVEIGMLKKVAKGYYRAGEIGGEDLDLEGEVARRLAEKPIRRQGRKGL